MRKRDNRDLGKIYTESVYRERVYRDVIDERVGPVVKPAVPFLRRIGSKIGKWLGFGAAAGTAGAVGWGLGKASDAASWLGGQAIDAVKGAMSSADDMRNQDDEEERTEDGQIVAKSTPRDPMMF